MVKLVFLYNPPDDPEAFDEYFFSRHLPLVDDVANLRRKEIARALGTPTGERSPYHLVAEYYFDSADELQAAFRSEAGARLNSDLANFAQAGFTAVVATVVD
jgi:uncharacterized protein (TIGR02118 family)